MLPLSVSINTPRPHLIFAMTNGISYIPDPPDAATNLAPPRMSSLLFLLELIYSEALFSFVLHSRFFCPYRALCNLFRNYKRSLLLRLWIARARTNSNHQPWWIRNIWSQLHGRLDDWRPRCVRWTSSRSACILSHFRHRYTPVSEFGMSFLATWSNWLMYINFLILLSRASFIVRIMV